MKNTFTLGHGSAPGTPTQLQRSLIIYESLQKSPTRTSAVHLLGKLPLKLLHVHPLQTAPLPHNVNAGVPEFCTEHFGNVAETELFCLQRSQIAALHVEHERGA